MEVKEAIKLLRGMYPKTTKMINGRIVGGYDDTLCDKGRAVTEGIRALEKQQPHNIYHYIEDDVFETSCCGIDITNEDFTCCPNCGCLLGDVEECDDI